MADPTFQRRSTADPLWLLEPAAGVPGAPGYRVAFLPAPPAPTAAALTITRSWDTAGVYLFLAAVPADPAGFAAALRTWLRFNPRARFVWIANPEAPPHRWRATLLAVNPAVPGVTAAPVTAEPSVVSCGDATLTLGAGCQVGLRLGGSTGTAVTFSRPAGESGARAFSLRSGNAPRSYGLGPQIVLDLLQETAGCLRFDLTVQAAEAEALDVAGRYFLDHPDYPGFGLLRSLRYPWFQLGTGAFPLKACLDPLSPGEGKRSFFAFSGTAAIPSQLRTPLGRGVALTPSAEARLVFAPRPLARVPGAADPLYLVPEGAFAVGAPEGKVLCGISGVEYAGLPAGGRMHFVPGQGAYAGADGSLAGPATTAWAWFSPPAAPAAPAVRYYAQPDAALLYEADDLTAAEILDFLEVPASALQRAPRETAAFPLAPYGGLEGAAAPLARRLETEVLAPLRRRRIQALSEEERQPLDFAPEPGDRVGATPQGLLARFRADGAWKTLTLARTGAQEVRWHGLIDPLRSALQRSGVFLVISDPAKLARYTSGGPPGRLSIAGWTFHLSPEDWAEHGTILVIKLQEGSLRELAADPARWTAAAEFNQDPAAARSRLRSILDEAVALGETDAAFAPFARLVTGPWNGVLFLRAKVPLEALPPQLQGLAAGIDPARFFAHHLGLQLTPVEGEAAGELAVGDSSLFGLIHYDDPEHQFGAAIPYAFKVLALKVRFENSVVAEFSSRVELMVNRLFDAAARLPDGEAGNNLVLDGVYQRQGEEESYVFLQEGSRRFQVDSGALEEVETVKAQFVTVVPPGGLPPGEPVRARFLLWGQLRFRELAALDLFSFGVLRRPVGPPPEEEGEDQPFEVTDGRLAFGNLAVEMSFDRERPAEKTFAFNATALSFDLARSAPRPESLFHRFPLKLTGLVQAAPGVKTADLGFIPVSSPLAPGALADPWYGLTFDIDLGSLGALSGGKLLTVGLLAGWGGGADPTPVFLGMKIPGTDGAKPQIPIEGVLKLTLKRIQLSVLSPPAGGRSYLLRFNKIALSLFGFSFPPGRTDIFLFGNPEGGNDQSVGWYAAFAKDPPPPSLLSGGDS